MPVGAPSSASTAIPEFGLAAVKIVALTARDRDEDRAESRRAGFDAQVAKPADPQTIDSILKTVFGPGPA